MKKLSTPVALAAVLGLSACHKKSTHGGAASAPAATLQVTLVEDQHDPLAKIQHVPKGVELLPELAPTGLDEDGDVQHNLIKYARVLPRPGESAAQTRARLLRWLRNIPVPAGERFSVEDLTKLDPDAVRLSPAGARSIVLTGAPVVSSADIANAFAARDEFGCCIVRVNLTKRGAQRFYEATKRRVKQRMAIVVDGVVMSAPIVQRAIPGGSFKISLENRATRDPCAAARRLAASLRKR